MSSVEEIRVAIESLPEADYVQLSNGSMKETGKDGIDRLRPTQNQESWIS